MIFNDKKFWNCLKIINRYCSNFNTIIPTVDGSNKGRPVMYPYVDYELIFNEKQRLVDNLSRRDIKMDIDNLEKLWKVFKSYNAQKNQLKKTERELYDTINFLNTEQKIEEAKMRQNQYEYIKTMKNKMEEYVAKLGQFILPDCQTIPNNLNLLTPDEDLVIYSFDPKCETKTNTHHLKVAERLSLVEYRNLISIFLLDDAALFELALMKFFSVELDKLKYMEFCNPDIVTSHTVEACGYDSSDPYETFILDNDDEHLVGGASLFPFCTFHARQSVLAKYLPERKFAAGRQYIPPPDDGHDGLYSAVQRSAVHVFIGNTNIKEDVMKEFKDTLDKIKDIYLQIGLHFRIVYVSAKNLKHCESLRANIELYSPYNQKYVEVGNLSLCDDYISKRMFIYYHKQHDYNLLHIISGSITNIQTLLACLLEYSESRETLLIPDCIRAYMLNTEIKS